MTECMFTKMTNISFPFTLQTNHEQPYQTIPVASRNSNIINPSKRRELLDKVYSEQNNKGNNCIKNEMPKTKIHKNIQRNNSTSSKTNTIDVSYVDNNNNNSTMSNKNTTLNSINNSQNERPKKQNSYMNVYKYINKPLLTHMKPFPIKSKLTFSTITQTNPNLSSKHIKQRKHYITLSTEHNNNNNKSRHCNVNNISFQTHSNVSKCSKSLDISTFKSKDGSCEIISSFINNICNSDSSNNKNNSTFSDDKIDFLSLPRLFTLINKDNKQHKRFLFVFAKTIAYVNYGIENYEISFLSSNKREKIISFNILDIETCNKVKSSTNTFKIRLKMGKGEFYIYTSNLKERDMFVTCINYAVDKCKCKAFVATEKFKMGNVMNK